DGIRSFSLHPGGIVTGLSKHIPIEQLKEAGNLGRDGEPVIDPDRDMKSIAQGAATHVWCAVSQQLAGMGGVFCRDSDIAALDTGEVSRDGRRVYGVAPYAIDLEAARRLWRMSESLSGIFGVGPVVI